ncbi:MAG: MBL fold metallo-hydrolase [Clostridiaceae bacterium]|nr:MBL fold metallo-hydrolase [Clostridiaceae bacterium]
MKILTLTVGPVRTNCYIAFDETTHEGFLVDPGDDAEDILAAVRANSLIITHILLTHGHFDHILALSEVKKATGAKIGIHTLDAFNLQSITGCLYARFCGSGGFIPMTADLLLEEGTRIDAASVTLTVLHTPGHTPGSSCFDTGSVLFTGDTLFAESCGRVDLGCGDGDAMHASLARLSALPGDRACYPGHGRAFTLCDARAVNPVLRSLRR